jgi:hypothetical protein
MPPDSPRAEPVPKWEDSQCPVQLFTRARPHPTRRRKREEAAKKQEQAKILGKGRAKLSFSFG